MKILVSIRLASSLLKFVVGSFQFKLVGSHFSQLTFKMDASQSRALLMASSPSSSDLSLLPSPHVESKLSFLVHDLAQQVNAAMENMLNRISEIDETSAGIMEEIEKSKGSVLERKKGLEEEKERFQKAAYNVLDMLNQR